MEKMEQTSTNCNPEHLHHTLNDLKSYVLRSDGWLMDGQRISPQQGLET
jgi:hypothetical protein